MTHSPATKDHLEDLAAASMVLSYFASSISSSVRLKLALNELRRLKGRGVSISPPSYPELEEGQMLGPDENYQTAEVTPETLLAEVLAPFGVSVAKGPSNDFLKLSGALFPSDCEAFFLLKSRTEPYTARAFSQSAALTVVFHASDEIEDSSNALFESLSVHAWRLRALPSLTLAAVEAVRDRVLAVAKALPVASATVSTTAAVPNAHINKALENARLADPNEVATYASSEGTDQLFEAATAKIIGPLVGGIIQLGGKLTGKPVPDGVVFRNGGAHDKEAAVYDCKSKHKDSYGLNPEHGDQQNRYLNTLKRLREAGWKGRGVLLFTPSVDKKEFDEQTAKEFWRQCTQDGFRLVVAPSAVLHRWHELTSGELQASFPAYFSTKAFWDALFDQALPYVGAGASVGFFSQPGAKAALLTKADAELCWLAGVAAAGNSSPAVGAIADALRAADSENIARGAVTRNNFLDRYFKLIRKKSVDLTDLNALGLEREALRYLVNCAELNPSGIDEAGEHAFANIMRLRKDLAH